FDFGTGASQFYAPGQTSDIFARFKSIQKNFRNTFASDDDVEGSPYIALSYRIGTLGCNCCSVSARFQYSWTPTDLDSGWRGVADTWRVVDTYRGYMPVGTDQTFVIHNPALFNAGQTGAFRVPDSFAPTRSITPGPPLLGRLVVSGGLHEFVF